MKWLFLTLAILSVMVLMPPIMYGYIYPSWGGDSAEHLIYFKNMDSMDSLYYGRYVVGKLLNTLPMDINVSFLWFSYLSFALVVWAIGVSVTLAIGYLAGILASILATFGFFQTISLFGSGTIFDLIGIGILLPILLLCLHKRKEGIGWKIGVVVSLVTFASCHENGKYLFALIPMMILYEIVRKQVSMVLTGKIEDIWNSRYLMYMTGLVFALLFGFTVDVARPNSIRLITDASILVMIILGSVLALYVFDKKRVFKYVLIAIAIAVSIPSMTIWFQYNNLVQRVDKQALVYLNTLPRNTYVASKQIPEAIYSIFVNKKYREIPDADYIIVRSTPITFRYNLSDYSDDYWVTRQEMSNLPDYMDTNGYRLIKEIDCGEKDKIKNMPIIIGVYEKVSN